MKRENNWINNFKKLPDFNFKKITLENIDNLDELNSDFIKSKQEKRIKSKKIEHHPETKYETIKEVYLHSMKEFSDKVFLLDKNNPREEEFTEYTFRQFGDDVEAIRNCANK